jgi:metal-sulfur cluster biosynthetic enzyme
MAELLGAFVSEALIYAALESVIDPELGVNGLAGVAVNLVWNPRWSLTLISAAGMAQLGLV